MRHGVGGEKGKKKIHQKESVCKYSGFICTTYLYKYRVYACFFRINLKAISIGLDRSLGILQLEGFKIYRQSI
jgi:hypothetical protein